MPRQNWPITAIVQWKRRASGWSQADHGGDSCAGHCVDAKDWRPEVGPDPRHELKTYHPASHPCTPEQSMGSRSSTPPISLFKAHANCGELNRCSLFCNRTCREIDSTSQTRQPASPAHRGEGGDATT